MLRHLGLASVLLLPGFASAQQLAVEFWDPIQQRSVRGVVADGVSPIEVRVQVPGNTWAVELALPAERLGGRYDDAAGLRGDAETHGFVVGRPVLARVDGGTARFTLRAPREFVRDGHPEDLYQGARSLDLAVRLLMPDGSSSRLPAPSLQVSRPPLLLAHGYSSGPETWSGGFSFLAQGADPRFPIVELVDYGDSSTASFESNLTAIRDAIDGALQRSRDAGMAATQVDYVGHSMGGALIRYYRARGERGVPRPWARSENGGAGDLHRMVLLHAPQWGAPGANYLEALTDRYPGLADLPLVRNFVLTGAVRDLGEGSAALSRIGATDIPTRVFVGTGVEQTLAGIPTISELTDQLGPLIATFAGTELFQAIGLAGDLLGLSLANAYRDGPHDGVVLEDSQRGGQEDRAVAAFESLALATFHTFVTDDLDYAAAVTSALDDPLQDGFATLPPVEDPAPGPPDLPDLVEGALRLELEPSGPWSPGQSVIYRVVPENGFVPDVLYVHDESGRARREAADGLEFPVTVPQSAVGRFTVAVSARDAGGQVSAPVFATRTVEVPAALQEITIVAPDELTVPAQQTVLRAFGRYADGVVRSLDGPGRGSSYRSSDLRVCSVDPQGRVLARGEGSAEVFVRNGAVEQGVPVTVRFASVAAYGFAATGSGGVAPTLRGNDQQPTIGNAAFGVELVGLVGGATVGFYGALAPAMGELGPWTIHLDPLLLIGSVTDRVASGAPGAPGEGAVGLPLPVPNDASLLGQTLFLQAFASDPGAPLGLSHSAGLAITFRNPGN